MTKPENTTKNPHPEWLFGRRSGAIEAQEAKGARQLHGSAVLPTSMQPDDPEVWKALGFELGEPFKDDPLFRPAKFPEGWRIEPSPGESDPRHLSLMDEKDRERAPIFYKAAFYDRKAYGSLQRRYSITYEDIARDLPYDPDCENFNRCIVDNAKRRDEEGYVVEVIEIPYEEKESRTAIYQRADQKAMARLNERFPDHDNVLAYW